jgi:hypothetical protein
LEPLKERITNCGRKKRDRKKTNKKECKHYHCDRDGDGEQDKHKKRENSNRRLSLPIQTKCCCIPWGTTSQPTINPTQKLRDWYQIKQSINRSMGLDQSQKQKRTAVLNDFRATGCQIQTPARSHPGYQELL